MKKDFVIRGQTASGETEILEFGGYKDGYAYKMTDFQIYPSTGIGSNNDELAGSVTAGKTAIDPTAPNFNNDGLIATAIFKLSHLVSNPTGGLSLINDTYVITQNLILMVQNTDSGTPVNWQCTFESVKMTGAEEAAVNYKQFAISDE